jgi:hypothetical protein
MRYKTKNYFRQDKNAKREVSHKISYKERNEIQQKVINQTSKYFICNKQFNFDNIPSWDRIYYNLPHTLENIVLISVPSNIKRSNRFLELMQTIIQRKQYAIDNHFLLVLTKIHVLEQM